MSSKIGKKILLQLSQGMYPDSKIIYREYIQNAADQVDYARRDNMFHGEDLYIDIKIESAERTITITDNATGIPKNQIEKRLADVADSDKVGGVDKGFIGIGRLAGLAYCNQLIFTTSYSGEPTKTIMTWDALEMKRLLEDKNVDDASSVLDKIIRYNHIDCDPNDHFFEVKLIGIRRENSDLLDESKVKKFISLNAPVPFNSKFVFKKKIEDYLTSKKLPHNEYKIYLQGELLYKLYGCNLYDSSSGYKKAFDKVNDLEFKDFYDNNGDLLAWLWYGVTTFEKQIPLASNDVAGLRLRKSNIQIGDERTLVPLFKETRGNQYFIGELHAVHKELLPNARRDYFIEDTISKLFEECVKEYFKELHQLYNDANKAKNNLKKIQAYHEKHRALNDKNGKFVNHDEKLASQEALENAKKEANIAKKDLMKLEIKAEINPVLDKVINQIKAKQPIQQLTPDLPVTGECDTVFIADDLTEYEKKQRKLIGKIYGLIKKFLPEDSADELISKIQNALKSHNE